MAATALVWMSPAPSSLQCEPHTPTHTQTDLLRNHLKNGLTERLKRFTTFTNSIARRTDRSFSRALMRRGHRGRIKFLHNEQRMKIEVQLPVLLLLLLARLNHGVVCVACVP